MSYRILEVHEAEANPGADPRLLAPAAPEPFNPDNPFDLDDTAPPTMARVTYRVRAALPAPEPAAGEVAELAAWLAEQTWSSFAVSLASQHARTGRLSAKQVAAAQSMRAKCEARAAARSAAPEPLALPEPEPFRIYRAGSETFAIVLSREGRPYAKTLEGSEWVYAGGAIRRLREALARGEARLLTREEALAHGAAWGRCICCGALLTREASVEAGIGPVCAGKWGLGL